MAFSDYQQHPAWQQALDLSLDINQLGEDLPANEQLALELMASAIEIPTMVAEDLLSGHKPRLGGVLRLQTRLELVTRIYPALDTARVERTLNKLIDLLQSPDFTTKARVS